MSVTVNVKESCAEAPTAPVVIEGFKLEHHHNLATVSVNQLINSWISLEGGIGTCIDFNVLFSKVNNFGATVIIEDIKFGIEIILYFWIDV